MGQLIHFKNIIIIITIIMILGGGHSGRGGERKLRKRLGVHRNEWKGWIYRGKLSLPLKKLRELGKHAILKNWRNN